MKKGWLAAAVVVAGGLLLIPRSYAPGTPQPDERTLHPQAELQVKQQQVSADVRMTDELCRSQCTIDFGRTINTVKDTAPESIRTALETLKQQHPHMSQLEWRQLGGGSSPVTVGGLDGDMDAKTASYRSQARAAVAQGQTYQSPPISTGSGTCFVLGVPSVDRHSAIIGVVHQRILQTVHDHQTKNLRVVPYPAEGNWKIESVDSKTLNDVTVDHPEDNEGTSHYHKNEVVVRFTRDMSDAELKQMQSDIQAKSMRKVGYTYVFTSDKLEAKQLMDYFKRWPIQYVEPHFLYLTNDTARLSGDTDNGGVANTSDSTSSDNGQTFPRPNDLLYSRYQWNLPIIETELGWDVEKGSSEVIVGVVDTGVDLNHSDLQGHLVQGANIVDPKSPPADDVGHGTHVTGVISALVNNNQGVAGMTWYNPVLPVKVLDASGAGSTYNVAQGLIWAVDHGAKVINMSLGNYADANFLHDAVKYAYDHDVVLVSASGNDNTDRPGYPAAYPEVLAVAATDSSKKKASFSNYGDYIDVAAPGVTIASTYPNNQYAALSGTSMASPHVAALAALIRSINPALKNTEVMDLIRQTAQDLGPQGKDIYFGYGQIDVVRALQAARDSRDSVSSWPTQLQSSFNAIERKYTGQ
jgi:subtilisin family serine protease